MQRPWLRTLSIALLPGAITSAIALTLWLRITHGLWIVSPNPMPIIGWLFILFMSATITAILWTAVITHLSARSTAPHKDQRPGRTVSLGYALLADILGLWLVAVGRGAHVLDWLQIIRLYFLFAAWLALWTALTWSLRRFGPGLSTAIPLLLSMLLTAAPIALMPLVHASATWGTAPNAGGGVGVGGESGVQSHIVVTIANTCPFFASLDALRPAITLNWPTLPGMYQLSGLGQEIPMALPHWWLNASLYAGIALLIRMTAFLLSRISRPPINLPPTI